MYGKATAKVDSFNRIRQMILALLGLTTLAVAFLCLAYPAQAQDAATKPKLVAIELNEKTNDPKALEIARKLNPDFFNIDQDYLGGSSNVAFYAQYLPLDADNPKKFMLLTVKNTPYWCTKYGCPFILYKNILGNKWQLINEFQINKLFYDANTQTSNIRNLIGRGFDPSRGEAIGVWIWYGNKYIKAEKK